MWESPLHWLMEEMTPGIWMRYQALGELEEQARAELYEFAQ